MSEPAIAPKKATTILSVSICLTRRQRVAPSAPRIASSFARKAARPNCMFITFTQAISKTRMTAPSMAQTIWRNCTPVKKLISGCTAAEVRSLFVFGLSAAMLRAIVIISAFAWSSVTPRFQPAHHGRRAIISAEEKVAAWCERPLIVERCPKLLGDRELKSRRHDADDGRGFAINGDVLSDNLWVSIEIASARFRRRESPSLERRACYLRR